MGKAKRFNEYDETVKSQRERAKTFGEGRQKLSIGSSFRSSALQPPTTSKIGAGTGTGDGKFLTVSLAADQIGNLAVNNHVEFDTKDEDGGIVLQTGAGQLDGIFELLGGKKYYLQASLRPEFSGPTGQLEVAWFDQTNSAQIGSRAKYEAMDHTGNDANQPTAAAIITPTTNVLVKLEILSVTALDALANEYCHANLFEIALGGSTSGGGSGGGGDVTFPITPTIKDESDTWTSPVTIDLSLTTAHITKFTLDTNLTLVFSNPPSSGTQIEFEIEFTQDATGGRTVTFPVSVLENVSISSASSSTTIVTCRTNDGGTNYHVIPALRGSISLTGSFANQELNNLAGVAINTSLISDTDNTDDLGSSGIEWKDLWIDGTANIDTLSATTLAGTITGADNDFIGIKNLKFGTTGQADNTAPTIWADATGDLVVNVDTADTLFHTFGGATQYSYTQTDADFSGNTLSDVGVITPTGATGSTDLGKSTNLWGDFWVNRILFTTQNKITFLAADIEIRAGASASVSIASNDTPQMKFLIAGGIDVTANMNFASGNLDMNAGNITLGVTSAASGDLRLPKFGTIKWLDNAATGVVTMNTDTLDVINISNSAGTGSLFVQDNYILGESSDPTTAANTGYIYCKDVGGDTHLFFDNSTESPLDISNAGLTAPFVDTTSIVKGSVTAGKEIRFEVDGFAGATTRVLTPPDADITIAGINLAQTWTADQTFTADVLSDGLNNLGTTANPWNNIVSDNTLFCSNLKVFDTDTEIKVFNDLDMQVGDTVDFNDNSQSAAAGTNGDVPSQVVGYIQIKVQGTVRKVPFYAA